MKVTSISLYMHGCQVVVTGQGTLTIRNGRFDDEESRALAVRMAKANEGIEVLESLTAVVLEPEADPINYWEEALACINSALGVRFDDAEQVFVPGEAPAIPVETNETI